MAGKGNSETSTQEIIAMFKDWWKTSPSPHDFVAVVLAATDAVIRTDQLQIGNLQAEYEAYKARTKETDTEDRLLRSMHNLIFVHWAAKSPNSFAVAYRQGRAHERKRIATANAKRATEGRKLIGAASRDKVRKASASYRHLSKELAAPIIAEAANLSPGTVRRYLSELFPGVEWKNL